MKNIIILLLTLLVSSVNAQLGIYNLEGYDTNISKSKKELKTLDKNTIKVDMRAYINNSTVNDNNYTIRIANMVHNYISEKRNMPDRFTLYLNYSNEYIVEISHPGTITKKIYINTNAPEEEDWRIYTLVQLKKGKGKSIYAGSITYVDSLQTFKALVIK